MILIKVQMVVTNFVSAASQTNIQNLAFDKAVDHNCYTNLAKAIQLLNYFNTDLDRAITGNELSTFQSVPPLYIMLMEASTGKKRSQDCDHDRDRTRDRDRNRDRTWDRDQGTRQNQDAGGSSDSSRHPPRDNNNKPRQMKGIFFYPGNMPQFRSKHSQDGVPHPPKLIVGSRAQIICMKGSAENKVCTKQDCTFLHLDSLEKVTGGLQAMDGWVNKTPGVQWRNKRMFLEAEKAKDAGEPGKE